MRQALVGMSGGVDSSTAAYLVREAGYEVTGATMRLFDNETAGINDKTCCSLSSIEDACAVANRLGINYVVYDMRSDFRHEVIDRFVDAYEHGSTPNPCTACNKYLKFDRLYELGARDLLNGSETISDGEAPPLSIATGHYAVIERSPSGRNMLRKGIDSSKDQSYFLYDLTQEQLARTLFPLGGLTKPQVREIAESLGLVNAKSGKVRTSALCRAVIMRLSYADIPDMNTLRVILSVRTVQSWELTRVSSTIQSDSAKVWDSL